MFSFPFFLTIIIKNKILINIKRNMNPAIYYDYQLKFILIGNPSVGKSQLLLRFTQDKFEEEYKVTLGVDFGYKIIEHNNKIFNLQLWDTAGAENFRSVTRSFYSNSVCALIVYDITRADSFENIQSWIDDATSLCPETVELVLIGNKNDLDGQRKITYSEGKAKAEENGMMFFESSAKTGYNVNEIIMTPVKIISDKIKNGEYGHDNEANSGIKKGIKIIGKNIKKLTQPPLI